MIFNFLDPVVCTAVCSRELKFDWFNLVFMFSATSLPPAPEVLNSFSSVRSLGTGLDWSADFMGYWTVIFQEGTR